MSSPPTPASRPRFAFQPLIVKAYKIAGIGALGAILVGLVFWVVVNLFYFFDDSWVRPVILGPRHPQVAAVVAEVAAAEQRLDALAVERARVTADLAQYERVIAASSKYEAEVGPAVIAGGNTAANAVARRALDQAVLDRQGATDGKQAAELRLRQLDADLGASKARVERLHANFYYRARSEQVAVGFVPYANLDEARPGATLYRCKWGLIRCSAVGKVVSIIEGEVTERHPRNDSLERGVMIELELGDSSAAEAGVLFAGSRPFWIF